MIDLKERYNYKELDQKSNVINALKKIGYKKDQIDIALKKTKLESNNLEENVKNVIKVISLSKTNLTKNVNT